jgi:hypothetical protein
MHNNRYSGPQLLSSWLHGAAPRQPSCHLPRKLGPLGPLSSTLGAGSHAVLRTVGVGFGIEDRLALARIGRERGRRDQAKLGIAVVAGSA